MISQEHAAMITTDMSSDGVRFDFIKGMWEHLGDALLMNRVKSGTQSCGRILTMRRQFEA